MYCTYGATSLATKWHRGTSHINVACGKILAVPTDALVTINYLQMCFQDDLDYTATGKWLGQPMTSTT